MAPNSRPPLTSRIRASFEGKRSQSSDGKNHANGVSNGVATVDAETLRNAIDQAINSETFQTAIAANLAKIIKPSIKNALDTIQPVIETVYQHDMLLRRTNASVENLLQRFNTNPEKRPQTSRDEEEREEDKDLEEKKELSEAPAAPTATVAEVVSPARAVDSPTVEQFRQILTQYNAEHTAITLSQLSNTADGNNKMLTELMTTMEDLSAILAPTKEHISSLKSMTEQSSTATSVMQAQLDQLQADVASIVTAIGTDLGQNVKALHKSVEGQDTSVLGAHTTKLDAVSADLTELKGHSAKLDILSSISEDVDGLKSFIQNQVGALDSQIGVVLAAVEAHSSRGADEKNGILAAIQESHSSHSASLDNLKDVNSNHTAAFEHLKNQTSRSVPASSSEPVSSDSSETVYALEALTADLASLRDNITIRLDTNGTNFWTLGTKIDTVLDLVEAIKDDHTRVEILEGVHRSNDSHAAHAAALDSLHERSLHADAPVGNEAIEPHLENIIKTLDLHTATLAAIPHSETSTTVGKGASFDGEIDPKLDTIISLLAELKESDVSAEILTAIHSCADNIAEIRQSDVSAEILTALHESNDAHSSHTAALGDIRAYSKAGLDEHAKHAEALEGMRSIPAAAATEGGNNNAVDEKMGSLITILEEHSASLADIKSAHSQHAEALDGMKSLSGTAPVEGGNNDAVEEKMGSLITILEDHSATLAEIKDSHSKHALSLDELKGHGATLAEIKEANTGHTAAFEQLKSQSAREAPVESSTAPAVDLSGLETQLDSIIDSLDTQKHAIAELKAASASLPAASSDDAQLLGMVKSNHEELRENLAALKAAVDDSRDGITAHGDSIKALHEDTKSTHEDTKASHAGLGDAIKALAVGGVGGAAAGAVSSTDNSEVLAAVQAVEAITKEVSEKLDAVKGDIEESEMTLKGLVKDAADEIKAEIDASGTDLGSSIGTVSGDVRVLRSVDVKGIVDASRKDIKNAIDVLEEQIRNTGSKVVDLTEAWETSKASLGQVRVERAKEVKLPLATDEQNWMKRPSRKKSGNEILPAVEEPEDVSKEVSPLPTPLTEEEPELPAPVTEAAVEEAAPAPVADEELVEKAAAVEEEPPTDPLPEADAAPVAPAAEEEPVEDEPAAVPQEEAATPPATPTADNTEDAPPAATDEDPIKADEADEPEAEQESASTSAITSPLSPAFSIDSKGSGSKKKGKKDKAEKKEKKGKKGKKELFVFDPDDEEGEAAEAKD